MSRPSSGVILGVNEAEVEISQCDKADYYLPSSSSLNNNIQDLFPPSPLPQSLPSAQNALPSASSTSVEEWIDRIFTPPTSDSSSSTTSHNTTFTSSKRKRNSSADCDELIEPHTLVPLTRRNLQRHSAAMTPPNTFKTPQKSDANTLSSSTQGTPNDKRTLPKGASWVRQCLEGHKIFREHKVFDSEDCKDFKQLVSAPFQGDRHSAVKLSSIQKYKEVYDYYKDLNEASFKTEILRLIVKMDFEIQLEAATETSQAVYGPSDSWNKGLRVQYNQPVNRGHIPHTYTDPQFDPRKVRDALKKEGILNAEPDAVWGFDPQNMPDFQLHPDTRELMLLLPKLNWPFFVIQSKQANGNFEQACNEANRDGIAIVSTARELCEKAGINIKTPGPDENTYVYSAVMDTKVMEWYVHWAQVTDKGDVEYHMNTVVENRLLKGENALNNLRSPTHNILDWALMKRKPMVEGWYKAIAEHDRQEFMIKSAPARTPSTTPSGSIIGTKRPRTHSNSA